MKAAVDWERGEVNEGFRLPLSVDRSLFRGVAAGLLDGSRVAHRPIAGDDAERRIALVWRQGHPRSEEYRLLGATIRDAVAGDGTKAAAQT